jgi:transglutaminase-like putative cysteine protease
MKISGFLFSSLIVLITGCTQKTDCSNLMLLIEKNMAEGNLKKVILMADSLEKVCPEEILMVRKADSLSQIAERIPLDFSLTEEQFMTRLRKNMPEFTPEDIMKRDKMGWVEYRIIDGEKRYFNRAASNLKLISYFHEKKRVRDSVNSSDPDLIFRKKQTESIISASRSDSAPVVPVNMTVEYSITVNPDAVPAGEIVRCWLPWPKESHPRQHNVKLISTSQAEYQIAPDSAVHRSLYMEARAEKGIPMVFKVSFSYQSSGQYFDLKKIIIKPYDKSSELFKKYTSEQLPQICFTPEIKYLTDSITGSETNPAEIVKRIYNWFSNNIPWAGALEYSIMPNIPEYVLKYKKGDCGMQTFLFMSMVRYKGIPVKWQSGWMMPPASENLHDWCEVYYEGTGWVPVDISYGLQLADNPAVKEFYISGIDSYRLIVNDGVTGTFYPKKKFMRSEPFDFQRGEVEWSGGNLYFDKWNYDMKIEYK